MIVYLSHDAYQRQQVVLQVFDVRSTSYLRTFLSLCECSVVCTRPLQCNSLLNQLRGATVAGADESVTIYGRFPLCNFPTLQLRQPIAF